MADERPTEIEYLDFGRYFPYTPAALCIRECIRLSKMRQYQCVPPVLDVGCGDGMFAQLAFNTNEVWGIDIDANEGRWAQASQAYSQIILGDIVDTWLPQGFFNTCVANCSLEHIPNLDGAMKAIFDSLKPGGIAYLFVPTREWAADMRAVDWSEKLGVPWIGRAVQSGIDGVFRHHHLYDDDEWRAISERAGFVVKELSPIGTVAATKAFEALLPPSAIGFLTKKLTGRWTLAPSLRKYMTFPAFLAVQAVLRTNSDTRLTAEYFLALEKPADE